MERLLVDSRNQLHHPTMKHLWGLNRWTSVISIDAFVEEVRSHTSCPPDLISRFRDHLAAVTAENNVVELSPLIINNLTCGLNESMDLNALVLAVTPKIPTLTDKIAHKALREIWLAGEKEKKLTSCNVTIADFNHATLKACEGAEITVPAKNLAKLLQLQFSSDSVALGDLVELCDGIDSELNVLDTVKAMVTKLECMTALLPAPQTPHQTPPPTPPHIAGPPKAPHSPVPKPSPSSDEYIYLKTSPFKYRADDTSPKKAAWCIYCGHQYATNIASETTKPMLNHVDKCPKNPNK